MIYNAICYDLAGLSFSIFVIPCEVRLRRKCLISHALHDYLQHCTTWFKPQGLLNLLYICLYTLCKYSRQLKKIKVVCAMKDTLTSLKVSVSVPFWVDLHQTLKFYLHNYQSDINAFKDTDFALECV